MSLLRFLVIGVCLGALLLIGGCQTPRASESSSVFSQGSSQEPVSLAAGDTIRLTFRSAPELNQSQKVRADGKISLPMVGEIVAAGKEPSQLQAELKARFASQLQNSEVTVTLESGGFTVYVTGAVAKSGKIVFDRPPTLLEVVMEAGGLSPRANARKVRVIRLVNGKYQSEVIDLRPALTGQATRPFYVRPNDVINVSENLITF